MLAFSINAFYFFLLMLKDIHLFERTAKSRFIGTSRKGIYPPDIFELFLILFLLVSYVLPINNAKMLTKIEKAEENIHYHANEIFWSTRVIVGHWLFFFEEIVTTVLKKVENNKVTIQPDLKIRGRSKPQHINL